MASQRNQSIISQQRRILAIAIGTFAVVYTLGVVFGFIPESRQLNATNLAILAFSFISIAILWQPDSLNRLKLLEMGGFKLELLEQVRESQKIQESRLDDISLMLPLLLPETERHHLFNLADKKTKDYRGGGSLRSELRRLRSIGLITMVYPDRHIGELTSNRTFNLADYIELTERGKRWVSRIREIEKAEAKDDVEM